MAVCPLTVDWGNVADWAAVLVGVGALGTAIASAGIALLGAAAVAYLGWQANRQVSHTDAENERIRQREADLLTILFEGELGMLSISLATFHKFLEEGGQRYDHDSEIRVAVARRVETLVIPEVDANFARLHVLPNDLGYSLARLKGAITMLRTTVNVGELANDEQAAGIAGALEKTTRHLLGEAKLIHGVMKARRVELVPKGR